MKHNHPEKHVVPDVGPDRSAAARDNARADREGLARQHLMDLGASSLAPRPWEPTGVPPSATDLARYALWRHELGADDVLQALALTPAVRAEAEGLEIGLLFAARAAGVTWAQIAAAMGFNSPQACQQHFNRLTSRTEIA